MDGRYPVPNGHPRTMTASERTNLFPPHLSHAGSLSRSKSDMDMSRLLRVPSSSQLSYNPPSSKSETFSGMRDEKHSGVRLLSRLLHKGRSSTKQRSWDLDTRPNISEPYNFRHLTHTGPAQAKALKDSDASQLVTEFSVIRASQAPKSELKGIKADNIISTYNVDSHSSPRSRSPSPPQSPKTVAYPRDLRSIKSVDSFTRLKSNSFSSPHPPISPPPRRSSRQSHMLTQSLTLTNIDSCLQPDPVTLHNTTTTSPRSLYAQKSAPSDDTLAQNEEIAQAVTTPDNSAQLFITHQRNISSAGLPKVPEEVELERTEARIRELQHAKKLRHAKSFPDQLAFQNQQGSYQTPQISEEIIPTRLPQKLSRNPAQGSWEADVDYCYQHAMEAVDYAWDDEPSWDYDLPQASNPYLGSFFIGPGTTAADSATSSAVSVPGIVTPTESAPVMDSFSSSHSLLFQSASTPLPQKEFNPVFPGEEHFQTQLPDHESIKIGPSYFGPGPLVSTNYTNSPRNSGAISSKYSSRESLNTRAASVFTGSGSSSKHNRNSSSIGSIPDMLPYGMGTPANSSDNNIAQKFANAGLPAPPQRPATSAGPASRIRANSESASRLLDLSMIGAPSPSVFTSGGRSRAGSVASVRGKQPILASRPSYNVIPGAGVPVLPTR